VNPFAPSEEAVAGSAYYNSLPREERRKLAPLLEHYRQLGLAEAAGHQRAALAHAKERIRRIQGVKDRGDDA
jgi:hypothetical protein